MCEGDGAYMCMRVEGLTCKDGGAYMREDRGERSLHV